MTQGNPLLAAALFVALLATGLALGPALAHLFAMPNKMALGPETYLATQQIYHGWAWLSVVLLVQLIAILTSAVLGRGDGVILGGTLVALAGLIGAQAVFWIWTYPANVATEQWTRMPENLDALRAQWEYSHAAGAILQLVAMAGLSFAAVSTLWRGTP
ncbi:MAG TPA: DUF1772 domain-containing protein [Alphaproteobacteria bacterium]|nr:DUF1772 domain-containing protein [Alphaproteobacteria bacterium]